MKLSLASRIEDLELSLLSRRAVCQDAELAAIRHQAEAILSVAEEDDNREKALRTLAAIELGQYRLPEPLPFGRDERAAVMSARLNAAFGEEPAPDAYEIPEEVMASLRELYPKPFTTDEDE